MQVVNRVEIEPIPEAAPPTRGGRAPRSMGAQTVEFAVPLTPSEDAVLLLEQDGMYSWSFAAETTQAPVRATRRGVAPAVPARQATFRIELPAAGAAERVQARRGVITDFVFGKVKAYVLKFSARIAVGEAMQFLERNVRRGFVSLAANRPESWGLVTSPAALRLPAERPAHVLLFIHGTFSSTIGAFGALGESPWGQKFLDGARATYDLILGFDHPTLSVDPVANATDLLTALQSVPWQLPPKIDVVTHSRGGLVARSLFEHLLPAASWRPQIGRVVFVAATHGGTLLAEPANWQALADLYTNLAVGTCRVLSLFPQAKAPALILKELIQGLGAFVKYTATRAVDDGAVPGLAAMEPDGPFITRLNQTQPGQPTIEKSDYRAITSEFRPRLAGDHQPKELPQRFLQWLAGGFIGQLMREANDLVVNTTAMTAIDPHLGRFIKDSLDFGPNPQVYHTNYFTRPEVANALARWLEIAEPAPAPALPPTRGRGGRGRETTLRGGPRAVVAVAVGGLAHPETPAVVDTDILVTTADTPFAELRTAVREEAPSYVVVSRPYRGQVLNYAFGAEEVLASASPGTWTVTDALNLHETDASPTQSVHEHLEPQEAAAGGATTVARSVVLEGNRPIGVLPEKSELPDAEALAALARVARAPQTDADRVQTRRALPTMADGGTVRAAAVAPHPAPSSQVTCRFHAEMDKEVLVRRVTTIEVLVSREVIGRATGATAAGGEAAVDPSRKLLLQVAPRRNFELVDDGRVEIDPPAPGAPQTLYFDVRPTHEGEGEVWVVARQGQVPLITLVLKPRIVSTRTQETRREAVTRTTGEAPRLAAPLNQLFIREQINGTEVTYDYQLQCPDLSVLEWNRSKPLRGDRADYVAHLYEEIEKRWLSSQNDAEDFAEELKAFGGSLFDELFPDDVQRALWDNRAKIESIMAISTEPFIPWELVYLKEPGKPVSPQGKFLGQMGLVRWLHEAGWPTDSFKIRQGRARYVIPHYPHPDYALPEAEKEAEFLENQFGATAVDPRPGPVRKLISQPGEFDLLHFACHGIADQDNITNAQLLMEGRIEGENYILEYLSATTAEMFSNLTGSDGNHPLVVLNACQTARVGYKLTGVGGFAQAFLKGGAGAFVSTLWSVGDSPARTFTESFYSELLAKTSISKAAIKARSVAQAAGDATWLAYVVYGHPHAVVSG
jgi:hypothetical protein